MLQCSGLDALPGRACVHIDADERSYDVGVHMRTKSQGLGVRLNFFYVSLNFSKLTSNFDFHFIFISHLDGHGVARILHQLS